MLLKDFQYSVQTPLCDSSASRLSGIAQFETDVSCVFPYLNARFPDCAYMPETPAVRLTSGGRVYAIHGNRIVTGVQDISEAQPAFDHIRDVINDTWQKRSEITPRENPRSRVSVLENYKSLPKTNCGACGEKTCMAFAAKLTSSAAQLESCPEMK
ncbi:MAG TPA: (Fe-S)-binding protein [Thermoguttaceae bacterium]|nr:(Fe-S)-binding protein [Thermoguttaceae bacterium]